MEPCSRAELRGAAELLLPLPPSEGRASASAPVAMAVASVTGNEAGHEEAEVALVSGAAPASAPEAEARSSLDALL